MHVRQVRNGGQVVGVEDQLVGPMVRRHVGAAHQERHADGLLVRVPFFLRYPVLAGMPSVVGGEEDVGFGEHTAVRQPAHDSGDEVVEPGSAIDSIAVLPLVNGSGGPDTDFLSDGITECLINNLARLPNLRILARSTVFRYKGQPADAQEVGRALKVKAVLTGQLHQRGNRVTIRVELVDVKDGSRLWGDQYNRDMADIFSIQNAIAREVADRLRLRLTGEQARRLGRRPTESPEAYQAYLQGRYHWNKRGLEDIKKAAEYFEQALKEDPNFALGYVGRADCHELLSANYGIDPTTNHEIARTAVTKALAFDGGLAEAHATLGLVLVGDLNLRKAEEEFRKAIELKPSYAPAHLWYFHVLIAELRGDEALNHIEKAVELDPFSQVINLNYAGYYEFKRDYEKSLELYQKAVELDPNFAPVHWSLGWVHGQMKNLDDARREFKIAADLMQKSSPHAVKESEAMIAYFENDKTKVGMLLPEVEKHLGKALGPDATSIAGLYFFLGEVNKGFEMLEQAFSRKEQGLLFLQSNPFFYSVRIEPRYQSLLKRMGLN